MSDNKLLAILRELRDAKLIELMSAPGQTADAFEIDPSACWFGMSDAGRNAWRADKAKYRDDTKT